MFESLIDQLSSNGKKLVNDGYFITEIEDVNLLNYFKNYFISYIKEEWKLDTDILQFSGIILSHFLR